ncbi:MAG: c-type cytochrome [Acidobacteriota bacterium]
MLGKRRTTLLGLGFELLLMASLLIVAPSSVPAQEKGKLDLVAAAVGRSSYRIYCGSCHGKKAKGDGPLAEGLKIRPADLTEISKRNGGEFPFDMVLRVIDGRKKVKGHGSAEMPVWGNAFLTTDTEEQAQERIRQLTHFLWSIQVDTT